MSQGKVSLDLRCLQLGSFASRTRFEKKKPEQCSQTVSANHHFFAIQIVLLLFFFIMDEAVGSVLNSQGSACNDCIDFSARFRVRKFTSTVSAWRGAARWSHLTIKVLEVAPFAVLSFVLHWLNDVLSMHEVLDIVSGDCRHYWFLCGNYLTKEQPLSFSLIVSQCHIIRASRSNIFMKFTMWSQELWSVGAERERLSLGTRACAAFHRVHPFLWNGGTETSVRRPVLFSYKSGCLHPRGLAFFLFFSPLFAFVQVTPAACSDDQEELSSWHNMGQRCQHLHPRLGRNPTWTSNR